MVFHCWNCTAAGPVTKSTGLHEVSEKGDKVLALRVYAAACASATSHAAKNQELMAQEGGIDMLVAMLESTHPNLQRQASKALANLGVNSNNKERICKAGGVEPLVRLAHSKSPGVAVEAVAALANLAVNGESTHR